MTTADTNVVVRFLVGDDPEQSARARTFFADEQRDIVILTTVLLEVEWVLRAAYGFARADVAETLRRLLGLPNVRAEAPERAYQALVWHLEGMDFADALHLAGSQHARALKTFDQGFAAGAEGRGSCPVDLL